MSSTHESEPIVSSAEAKRRAEVAYYRGQGHGLLIGFIVTLLVAVGMGVLSLC